ncbi:hypothetical protein BJ742DRAFT_807872 [Cladochytrium replicatum]|nr:hypothetical protein BJ742DRAFT_807872 [Cladochytrium replicatum]
MPPIYYKDVFLPSNLAVITGSASGIGRATAIRLASFGMHLVLADRDFSELARTVADIQSASPSAKIVPVETDVSSPQSVAALAAATSAAFPSQPVRFLMNNAGTGTGGGALASLEAWTKTMGTNFWGVVNGTQAFLPGMLASKLPSIVVNTGSKQGITSPPGNLAYNVSKAGVKAYTEGLQHELRNNKEGGQVSAHLLVPGWVNTSIFLKEQRDRLGADFDVEKVAFHENKPASGAWMPSQVVDYMLEFLKEGKFYIICPDNEVSVELDKARMTWTMQDITEDRVPLSRWDPEYADGFKKFLEQRGR